MFGAHFKPRALLGESNFSESLVIPSQLVSVLHGNGGHTVQRLEEGCGVRIHIPRVCFVLNQSDELVKITINGLY